MDVENQWKLIKIMELQCFFPLVLGMVVFFFHFSHFGVPTTVPRSNRSGQKSASHAAANVHISKPRLCQNNAETA